MARVCQITGKGTVSGHNVSHAQNKTKRTFKANLQWKNLMNPATGQMMRVRLAASALRTIKKWQAEGKKYDLRELIKEAK